MWFSSLDDRIGMINWNPSKDIIHFSQRTIDIIIKNNLITGVGYDNFNLAYPEKPRIMYMSKYTLKGKIEYLTLYIIDNAHNVYLHVFATTGILGLIPYLLLCLLTFIKGLKSKDVKYFAVFGGFVGYSIQAFANLSVIQVAPIYYILIGLILSEQKNTSYIK